MEDWLKCQISPLVKFRQNHNNVVGKENIKDNYLFNIYPTGTATLYLKVSLVL